MSTENDGFYEDEESFGFDFGDEQKSESEMYKDGGGQVEKNGKYHMVVEDPKMEFGQSDKLSCISLRCKVLAGTEEDQIGKVVFHRLFMESWQDSKDHAKGKAPLSDGMRNSNNKILIALDAIPYEKSVDGVIAIGKYRVDKEFVEMLSGLQMVAEVRMSKKRTVGDTTYDPRPEIPFGNAWPLTHEDVVDVPKDLDQAPISQDAEQVAADL